MSFILDRFFYLFGFFCIVFLHAVSFASFESSCNSINSHLFIGDFSQASKESHKLLENYPNEQESYILAMKSFGSQGDIDEMFLVWNKFYKNFPEKAGEQDILENICWRVLHKGIKGAGASTQLISIIGAALAQDVYAVPFLLDGLRHTNAKIRSVSVQLSSYYGDQVLQDFITEMFAKEKVLEVRLEVIKAIAKLHMNFFLPKLLDRLSNFKITTQERLAISEAIVNLSDKLSHNELLNLSMSSRSELRELSCEIITRCNLNDEGEILYRLIHDTNPSVQMAAIKGIGMLRMEPGEDIKQLSQHARNPYVGIAAGWVWLLSEPDCGEKALGRWLNHNDHTVRNMAAAAVASSGNYGVELAKVYLNKMQNGYEVANLALFLISQRENCIECCSALDRFLCEHKEKFMFDDKSLFPILKESTVVHTPAIPNLPEVVNQSVRLEVLNLLAMLDYPRAHEVIKSFLRSNEWGITGLAAMTLLGEGDEKAIDQVRMLLKDGDPNVRLEAALVLASWGKDQSALPCLTDVYERSDRRMKIKILEALGRIGKREIVPFLFNKLQLEQSLVMRLIISSVVLQILNA